MTFAPVILLCVLLVVAIAVLLVVAPLWLLVGGIVRLARCKGGAVRTVVGGVWTVAAVAAVLFVADCFDSRHERILDRGFTPDGREYCLLRVMADGRDAPSADIRLYVRNRDRIWMCHYVDRMAWPWRSGGHLDFSDGTARVFRGDRFFRTIELLPPERGPEIPPEDQARIATMQSGRFAVRDAHPPSATPESILSYRWRRGPFDVTNGVLVDLPAPIPATSAPRAENAATAEPAPPSTLQPRPLP